MCRKVAEVADDHPFRPFCSARCRLADLDNWLSGTYRISTPLENTEDDPVDPNDVP
ncbi:MAG TPA: DNA gyrase inhibitor YacG [Polyangiaceae bacterium]|jgi:hypothetical protein|nr:DNA gyrase inhibitor YacG [Polyangiaceae bacterium]